MLHPSLDDLVYSNLIVGRFTSIFPLSDRDYKILNVQASVGFNGWKSTFIRCGIRYDFFVTLFLLLDSYDIMTHYLFFIFCFRSMAN